MKDNSRSHLIERKECPVCGGGSSEPVSPNGNFRRCIVCGLLYRKKARLLIPEIGWDKEYYEQPEILRLHEERRSLFGYIVGLGGKPNQDSQWLDVGCGIGMLLSIARKAEWRVSGIDPSRTALDYAKKLLPDSELFCAASVNQLPENKMFDVISVTDVLRCIENPGKEVEAIHNRLRPGGKIIIREINGLWFPLLRKKSGDGVEIEVSEYLQEWNSKELKKMLLDVGFENVVVRTSPVFTERASLTKRRYLISLVKHSWKYLDIATGGWLNSLCMGPNMIALGFKREKSP